LLGAELGQAGERVPLGGVPAFERRVQLAVELGAGLVVQAPGEPRVNDVGEQARRYPC
jgi:hypothetical protein